MPLLHAGILAGIFFLFTLFGSSCKQSLPTNSGPTASSADVLRFLAQLDSLKALPTDTAQSFGLRALYNAASPAVRRATAKPVLKAASNLLFYHTAADTLLLPFYRSLCVDKQLLPVQRAQASQNLAAFYAHFAGNADSANFYLSKATTDTAILDDTLRGGIASTQAQIYQIQGNLPAATHALYQTIALSEKIGDSGRIAKTQGNLANVYRTMEDFSSATFLRKKALVYFQAKRDDAASFISLTGLAADYISLKQFDSARSYISRSEALLQKGMENPVAEYFLYLSAGGMYVDMALEDYDSAIYWFNKAQAVLPRLQNPTEELYFTIASARAYAFRQDVTLEARLIEETIPQLLADSNLLAARDAYQTLYFISRSQPRATSPLSPLDYYLVYDSLRSVLADDRNRAYVAEMAAQYGAEKQNLIIRLQEREIKQKSTLNGVLVLSALSVVLAGCVLFVRLRLHESHRKAKLQERFTTEMLKHTEAERGRIAIDLHDGIGHELLTLKNSLQHPQSDPASRIDVILNNIRMMSRNLHPVMLDKIGLEHSIYALCDQITHTGQLFVSAEIDYQKQLTPECELQLYRILQESLSNAMRYANAQAAKVTIRHDGHTLLVSVLDNGKGFDVEEKLASDASFGLHSILERSKVLGGKAAFHSSPKGTTLSIEIPFS